MEKCRAEDIDGDWIADLPNHVEATQLDLQTSDTVARLEALTYSGRLIVSEARFGFSRAHLEISFN